MLAVKNPPVNAGDVGLIPQPGKPPGQGHGNPLQYSCLETPMARGAWWATVHGKSWTQWKRLNTHMHTPLLQMRWRQTGVNSLVQGHKTMSDGVGDEWRQCEAPGRCWAIIHRSRFGSWILNKVLLDFREAANRGTADASEGRRNLTIYWEINCIFRFAGE